MNWVRLPLSLFACVVALSLCRAGEPEKQLPFLLVFPQHDPDGSRLAQTTLSNYLDRFFDLSSPVANPTNMTGTIVLIGSPETNPLLQAVLKNISEDGVKLTTRELGDEGFQILSHEKAQTRFMIVYGKTPRALKHACQELIFYRMQATRDGVSLDWPVNVVSVPEFPYRGIYMLPCWSAHDSIESWERVLRFNSELTLNRNWFWLDGFPVAGHTGEYTNTPLADDKAVQRLIDLVNDEGMKFYIGGGWITWHHKKAVGRDIQKGKDYYLDYLKAFKGVAGFYFEPTGEPWSDGRGEESKQWLAEVEGLTNLIHTLLRRDSHLEIALAIGRWNNPDYLKRMATLDPKRVYWWWCWGNPVRDKAMDLFPNVLRWHNQFHKRSNPNETHGARDAPMPEERKLIGIATSYDPGGGFGSLWGNSSRPNFLSPELIFGGTTKAQDYDPYTIPYFYLQYFVRERCWNLDLTNEEFEARLQRRLFDADAPGDAGKQYVRLSLLVLRCYDDKKAKPMPEELAEHRAFLKTVGQRTWTPRMADTVRRMEEALTNLEKLQR